MEVEGWENSSGGTSDSDVCVQDTNDEEHYFTSGDIPKLQFRKNISRARWDDEVGMAEVAEKKGGMWTTTGIVRGSKMYCSIEEALFLAERGELSVVDGDDSSVALKDLYAKVAKANCGCCWESFEVYRHLRSLGYIVRRHGNPWTMKSARNESASAEKNCGGPSLINELLNNMRIDEVRPAFDVYLPNSKFRKSSPGNPSFVLCVTRISRRGGRLVAVLNVVACITLPMMFTLALLLFSHQCHHINIIVVLVIHHLRTSKGSSLHVVVWMLCHVKYVSLANIIECLFILELRVVHRVLLS